MENFSYTAPRGLAWGWTAGDASPPPLLFPDNGKGGGKGGGKPGGSSKGVAPTDITLSGTSVDENAAAGTLVGVLDAEDADRREKLTFVLLDDAGGRFAVEGTQLIVADGSGLDYEAAPSHLITVQVTDKYGLSRIEVMEISINDIAEDQTGSAPTDIALSDDRVEEGAADGALVGLLSAVDPDNDAPFSYRLIDSAGGRFAIDGDRLLVADGSIIDFETAGSHRVTVEASDAAGNRYSEDLTIEVTDVAEPAPPPPSGEAPLPVPDYVLSGLLPDGAGDTSLRWNVGDPLGSAVTISYSFLQSVPDYYASTAAERNGFTPLSAVQQDAVRESLALIEQFTQITFVETSGNTLGELTFGMADLPQGSGWAYLPSSHPSGGDVWLDTGSSSVADPAIGSSGFGIILHEIGHALGLKHPHDGERLPQDVESRKYTVMAYPQHPDMPGADVSSYMMYDIAALQYLYGANLTAAVGDDLYALSNVDNYIATIWDAGGWDVLDASGSADAVVLDLNQASFSSSGTLHTAFDAVDNVAIAHGTVIEEARGGLGDDRIVGNGANNVLSGSSGADVFAFLAEWGSDLIGDFEDGVDLIDLSALGVGFGALSVGAGSDGAVVSLGGDQIVLAGVAASAIDEADFLFGPLA